MIPKIDKNDSITLMKASYDLNGVSYTIYNENNRFKGTPVPFGYEAVYVPSEDFIPDSLQLRKINEK